MSTSFRPTEFANTERMTAAMRGTRFTELAVLGCGLLGCSFALAAKQMGLVKRVVGYSRSPSTVETAKRMGAIDAGADSALQAVSSADLILLAGPVSSTAGLLKTITPLVSNRALILDVGSTKRDVIKALESSPKIAAQFVPSHPIAGKDLSGPEAADGSLFIGKTVVLCPQPGNTMATVERAMSAWEGVGAHVTEMTAEEHDACFASVSHLPHALAFAYMNAVTRQPQSRTALDLAGSGFADFTRIAGSSPEMWRDILLANRDEVMMQMQLFKQNFAALETAVQANDAVGVLALIERASIARRQWTADHFTVVEGSDD
jgi:prephenate dehydrogenase